MKSSLGYVSTTYSSRDNLNDKDFPKSDLSKTPLGALYLALLGENSWSEGFSVYGSFGEQPFLTISSPLLKYSPAGTRNFLIHSHPDGTAPSVNEVAMMALKNFKDHKQTIESAIGDLRETSCSIENGEMQVLFGLAQRAVHAKFPTAALGKKQTDSVMKFFWFESKARHEIYAVKAGDLMKLEEVTVYHLTDVWFESFKGTVYLDSYAAEQVLDKSLERVESAAAV